MNNPFVPILFFTFPLENLRRCEEIRPQTSAHHFFVGVLDDILSCYQTAVAVLAGLTISVWSLTPERKKDPFFFKIKSTDYSSSAERERENSGITVAREGPPLDEDVSRGAKRWDTLPRTCLQRGERGQVTLYTTSYNIELENPFR